MQFIDEVKMKITSQTKIRISIANDLAITICWPWPLLYVMGETVSHIGITAQFWINRESQLLFFYLKFRSQFSRKNDKCCSMFDSIIKSSLVLLLGFPLQFY